MLGHQWNDVRAAVNDVVVEGIPVHSPEFHGFVQAFLAQDGPPLAVDARADKLKPQRHVFAAIVLAVPDAHPRLGDVWCLVHAFQGTGPGRPHPSIPRPPPPPAPPKNRAVVRDDLYVHLVSEFVQRLEHVVVLRLRRDFLNLPAPLRTDRRLPLPRRLPRDQHQDTLLRLLHVLLLPLSLIVHIGVGLALMTVHLLQLILDSSSTSGYSHAWFSGR
mmetsp:Transcript_25697/g.47959  ORF Transcript_25697/g.47959 Transcript_25697/m.47959 type:complete len:217 (+) Transcript_25697:531-1181(+)